MKKFILACISGGWLLCGACAHHPQPSSRPADSLSRSDTAGHSWFPVADVLESEIRQVDSTPIAIRKFVIGNGHTDSGFIKPEEFNALASQFVVPEFRNGQFEKEFTETSFMDDATQAATFTYSTTDKDLPLFRVDVIAVPQGAVHRVKSIYIERRRTSGDSSILDKMYWQAGRQFQVVSLISVKGTAAPVERQLVVSWGSNDDGDGDNE
ncbi:MAG TPA: hypothetical protein VL978_09565 [Puia sp.]|nr:hypothetical protein [Puia sp.]